MDVAGIAEVAGGAGLVVLGAIVLRYNRATAEQIAEWNKFQYDRRATLYDLDRAERLQRLYEPGRLDRLAAGFLAFVVMATGVIVALNGIG
jgi:hypothetical protein